MNHAEKPGAYKYRQIYDALKKQLQEGLFPQGKRLPTEAQLSDAYSASRPTVTKALNALRKEGLITRKSGSGSYSTAAVTEPKQALIFGLLVPLLGKGEIFEPICSQIAALAEQNDFSLLWIGSDTNPEVSTNTLEYAAQKYIDTKVSGVFFAPVEYKAAFKEINRNVVTLLENAQIPVVLLDSDYVPFPERSNLDLINIDNFRSGYFIAQHYLEHGMKRVDFIAQPYSAYTVGIRIFGYKAALEDAGIKVPDDWIHIGDPRDVGYVRDMVDSGASNLICGNDATAADLMHTLEKLSLSVPETVRIIGFDDVHYSKHLSVPLTTIRQPCRELGSLAVETMLWRLQNPDKLARTITIQGTLIIRKSCGC